MPEARKAANQGIQCPSRDYGVTYPKAMAERLINELAEEASSQRRLHPCW